MSTRIRVRAARSSDEDDIVHVCLLTANAGKSAVPLLSIKRLPADVWALPYVNLPTGFGFVMVEDCGPESLERIVGYVIGTSNTSVYEKEAEMQWWPALRETYAKGSGETPLDRHYVGLVHSYVPAPQDILDFSPAHVHIDILPEYQRCGWGRRLMHLAVQHLESHGVQGLWVGSNGEDGRNFYRNVGFQNLRDKWMGLKFENFAAPQTPCQVVGLSTF